MTKTRQYKRRALASKIAYRLARADQPDWSHTVKLCPQCKGECAITNDYCSRCNSHGIIRQNGSKF